MAAELLEGALAYPIGCSHYSYVIIQFLILRMAPEEIVPKTATNPGARFLNLAFEKGLPWLVTSEVDQKSFPDEY